MSTPEIAAQEEQRGANARAAGLTEFDCPWFRPEHMPAATGELVSDWNAKAEAWRRGWMIEDAIQGAT